MATIFNTTIPISQLSSPLILLPPNVARNVLLTTYIHLGTVSVLLWDIINNIRNDWHLVSSLKVGLATCVYFTTRTSLLAYSLSRCVILTRTVENCAKFQDALNSFLIIFVASTTFLFYIRVTTLYAMDKTICILFGLAWLCTTAVTATFSITFTAEPILPTEFCIEKAQGHLFAPAMLVQVVNDLMLYSAITHRAYQTFIEDSITKGTLNPLEPRGTLFSTLSKCILFKLEPAQSYCLAVVATKVFLACAAFAFRHPTNSMFMICHLVLVNIWSGRMYRAIRRITQPRPSDAPPRMITQGEYELRLSMGRTSARSQQQTSAFGEHTYTPELDVRIPGQGDKSTSSTNEEKRTSTIYSVEGDIKA